MQTMLELVEHHIHLPSIPCPILGAVGGRLLLMGFGVKESTGAAAAEVDLFDGKDVTGQLVAPVTLTAGQGRTDYYGPGGVLLERGYFPNLLAGAVTGAVYLKFLDGSWS